MVRVNGFGEMETTYLFVHDLKKRNTTYLPEYLCPKCGAVLGERVLWQDSDDGDTVKQDGMKCDSCGWTAYLIRQEPYSNSLRPQSQDQLIEVEVKKVG